MKDWLEDQNPKMRDAWALAQRASIDGDCQVVENGYAHECTEPDQLGRGRCCIEAGSEILINPTPWQLMEGTARVMGGSVHELFGWTDNTFEDEDMKLSRKWKDIRSVELWRKRRTNRRG